MEREASTKITHAPSRPAHLRQANARGLLQLLQRHTPCSKADLVRLSGLSAPTVAGGVSHLERLGLVESIGEGRSKGGRPPEMLRFNAGHGYVAAADIGGTRLRMMLADLEGESFTQWSTVLPKAQKTPVGVCSLVHVGFKIMCRQADIAARKVLHLTAAAPGITDVDAGVVLSAPNLRDWNHVPLRSMLEAELGLPVTVENDTNLAAVGEYRKGAATNVENFVFVALGTGVGAGIFLRGQLLHGAQWCAGEVGYFGIGGRRRQPMRVRETGQLERELGGAGIEAHWSRLLQRLPAVETADLMKLRASQILDLARDGDLLAREVLEAAAALLADALIDIALLLNPQLIVLGGGIGSHPELCRATQAQMRRHEFALPELRSSALGTRAQLIGAISLSITEAEARLFL